MSTLLLLALSLFAEIAWIPAKDRKSVNLSAELQTLDGKKISLKDLRGKTVLVNVWATWCAPCEQEMPSMAALYKTLRNDGLEMVAVTIEDAETVRSFLKDHEFPFTVLLDRKERLVERLRVEIVPTTFLLDSSGKLALRHPGAYDWSSPEIILARRSLMAQSDSQR